MTDRLSALREFALSGERGVMVTSLVDGSASVLSADGQVLSGIEPVGPVLEGASEVLRAQVPQLIEYDGRSFFVEPITPPPRLLVFGAIAVADALVPMAAAAGFAVEVVDQRPWLAASDRYPDAVAVHCGEPVEVIDGMSIDASTCVVSFLHEPRLEDGVLMAALTGRAAYVGAMGSRRTTAAKRERLAAAGLTPGAVERLHAPIGLDIGGVTPGEIAVAVLAQIVAVRRGAA